MPITSRKAADPSDGLSDVGTREILLAMLALMVDERESRLPDQPSRQRVELVLAQAGLSAAAIAQLLNKQVGTVQMALYRAKTKDPSTARKKSEAGSA